MLFAEQGIFWINGWCLTSNGVTEKVRLRNKRLAKEGIPDGFDLQLPKRLLNTKIALAFDRNGVPYAMYEFWPYRKRRHLFRSD